uniref:MAM domain containing 4 n=1 Tax=Malurus cyaneus samueli TaxID=2593467 RepID=A0A8C5X5H5_9PASS
MPHVQERRALCHLLRAPCLLPCGVFSPIVSPIARTALPSGSVVVNSCSGAAEQLCNFICDCSDCSDENQCGYLRDSAVLGTPFTCDFEDSDCGWQDVGTSTYGWVRGRASLATWGVGSHSDHTVGTDLGKQELLGEQALATAWLRSPEMQQAAATCEIRAWYQLSGKRPVLRLALAHKDEVVGLWQSPEHSTEGWHQLVAYPGRITEQFQLIFSLTQPPTCGAEVALDDIMFRNCGLPEAGQQVCRAQEQNCRHGSCLAEHRFCDGTDDCGDGSDEGAEQSLSSSQPYLCGIQCPCPEAHPPPYPQLVLYCHLHGSATSSLSISYKTNSTKHLMRERTGDLGNCWVRERVDFSVTGPFKVLIEGVAGSSGTVAIDDLILSQGCVKEQGELVGSVFHPAPARAAVPVPMTPSLKDLPYDLPVPLLITGTLLGAAQQTLALGASPCGCDTPISVGDDAPAGCWAGMFLCPGTFLALQTGEGQMVGPAKAQTPSLGPSGPACTMEMSYHILSDPQGNLLPRFPACSLPISGVTAGGRVRIALGERSRPFQVELLALMDLQGSASVGVDNVTFEQCYLDVVSPTAAELSCNFEMGTCGWYQDLSSDFRWIRSTGQGQGSDHTTGSGYFLSIDPSVPWSRGQRALLLTSHQEPAAAPRCLSFWYRLAGPQIGTLNLKLRPEGGEEMVLWTCRGSQGSLWHRAWATLPATGQQRYQVAFEVLRDGFLGDVGLDDVALTAGPCGAKLSCTFEAGDCGLAASGKGTWQRQSNGTGTTAGPATDHTIGTTAGHYMVVSTDRISLPAGHTAALTSQPYQPTVPTQCLVFWYQLSTSTPGWWGQWGAMSGVWRLPASACHPAQVVLEALGAGGDHGYIALDDLHVSDGACPGPASCDFELDTCGWSSPSDPRLYSFAWGWKSGITLAKYPSPEQDHTLGTRNGHYMHFDTSVLGARGTSALLESPPLPVATDSCLRFWYHMDIPEHLSSGELRVTLHSAVGKRTVWTMAGHRSQGWQGAVVPVQSPSEFQVSGATPQGVLGEGGYASAPQTPPFPADHSFVVEVVLSLLLALIVVALVVAGGWYWLKQRGTFLISPAFS